MKIIRMKRQKKELKTDMFVVLSLVQFVIVALIVLTLFIFTKINAEAFDSIKNDLLVIFGEDMDLGGYFTPSEEKTESDEIEPAVFISYDEVSDAQKMNAITFDEEQTESDVAAAIPVSGTVTSYFGNREHPIYSGDSFHGGVDIAADEGTDICAVLDGTVTESGTAEMAGNYIKIEHADGSETLYCHCSELYVSEGETVSKGDVIAAVGQTGLATGPHLHLELHIDGESVDPLNNLTGLSDVY